MPKHHNYQTMSASIHSQDFSMPSEVHQQLIISKKYAFFKINGYIPQVKNSQYLAYSGIVMVVVLAFADLFFFFVHQEAKVLQFVHNCLIKQLTLNVLNS